jgi:hypothetical protein
MTTSAAAFEGAPARMGWRVTLWIVQVLLAALFAMAGFGKLAAPMPELVQRVGLGLTKFIGVAEITGALGLVLPAATRFRPHLTPLAAAGLGVVMLLATTYHIARGEAPQAVFTVVLGSLAALVVYGRVRKAPVAER